MIWVQKPPRSSTQAAPSSTDDSHGPRMYCCGGRMKIAPLEAVQNRRVEGAQGSQCFPFTGISRDFFIHYCFDSENQWDGIVVCGISIV